MRKYVVWASAVVAAIAVLFLLAQRKAKTGEQQSDDKTLAVSSGNNERKTFVEPPEDGQTAPSGLAAAYAPGVVVITNGVLAHDTRKKVSRSSEEFSRYKRERHRVNSGGYGGAETKVTFHVVGTDGESVSGALVGASLNRPFGKAKNKGLTDDRGLFAAEGLLLSDDLIYTVEKDGYYQTRQKFSFEGPGIISLENGRNIPWNPTLRITLKEIRKPIPMYMKRVSLPVPVRDQPVGFDFEAGDWVAPYGKGSFSDMQLAYIWTTGEGTWRRHDFTVAFTTAQDGAYISLKDEYCPLMSEYEARLNAGYAKRFQYVYERTDNQIVQDSKLDKQEIMVFRVRTETNPQGEIVNARYGKIYGPFEFAQGREKFVRFTYYFNPTPNDRNLEFDGEHNLSDPRWRNPIEPR